MNNVRSYSAYLALLNKAKCPGCNGTGQRDSSSLGDKTPRTWMCGACDGTGLKRGAKISVELPVDVHPAL